MWTALAVSKSPTMTRHRLRAATRVRPYWDITVRSLGIPSPGYGHTATLPFLVTLVPQSTAISLSFLQLSFLPCLAIQRSVFRLLTLCIILTCPFTSLTRVSTGATTMDTLPIRRRTHTTSTTTTQIPSRLPTITPQRPIHHAVKNTNRVIHPWVSILFLCHTGSPRHQITTKHMLRPLIFLTRSLHRHRHLPFISNRSSSMLVTHLAHLARHIVPPTFTFLPHLR
jgi:hypothetical protein